MELEFHVFFFFFYLKVWFHITRFSKNWVFHWNSIFRKSSLKQEYFARYFQNKNILLESFSKMGKCPFWPQISLKPIQSECPLALGVTNNFKIKQLVWKTARLHFFLEVRNARTTIFVRTCLRNKLWLVE